MKTRISDWVARYRSMDWAVLYMRLFAGGIILFHNIGKLQNYNQIIDSYPTLLQIDPAAMFILVAVAEVVLAVLIIIGLWVRLASLILSLGLFFMLVWRGLGTGDALFVWVGIYIFLFISGGGIYSFDWFISASGRKK